MEGLKFGQVKGSVLFRVHRSNRSRLDSEAGN